MMNNLARKFLLRIKNGLIFRIGYAFIRNASDTKLANRPKMVVFVKFYRN